MVAPVEPAAHRSWPQKLLIAFNVMVVTACVVAVAGAGWFYYRFGQIERISGLSDILDPPADVEREAGPPQNYLLVGSDSREFVNDEADEDSFGNESDTGAARSDTIILLRVDPAAEKAAMLSFPRDLWVEIAGTGGKQRINTAFSEGPDRLIETIKLNFGIPINHYVQVDFQSFKDVVDAVGGVNLYLASPVRDKVTGLNITDTGCVTLGGDQALAYVRSREYQYQEDGKWRSDPSGDIGRIARQQDFIRRAMREALSRDLLNPARLNRLVSAGINNVAIDESLSIDDILDLGKRFRSLAPEALDQRTLPVVNETIRGSGAQVLLLDDGPEAQAILDIFRGVETTPGTVPDVAPSAVTVRVLNGSGRSGEATSAADGLGVAGFGVAGKGDGTFGTQRTTILYGPGQEAKASLVERYLVAGADVRQGDVEGVDVLVLTGLDYTGVLAAPRPADAAPPTTAPTTTVPGGVDDFVDGYLDNQC